MISQHALNAQPQTDELGIAEMLEKHCEDITETAKREEQFRGDHKRYVLSNAERKVYRMMLFQARPYCYYCTRKVSYQSASLDHILPIVKGGDCRPSNLCLTCKSCNSNKGSMTVNEWLIDGDKVVNYGLIRRHFRDIKKSVNACFELFGHAKGCSLVPIKFIADEETIEE